MNIKINCQICSKNEADGLISHPFKPKYEEEHLDVCLNCVKKLEDLKDKIDYIDDQYKRRLNALNKKWVESCKREE